MSSFEEWILFALFMHSDAAALVDAVKGQCSN